jgi:hypothetical protein
MDEFTDFNEFYVTYKVLLRINIKCIFTLVGPIHRKCFPVLMSQIDIFTFILRDL